MQDPASHLHPPHASSAREAYKRKVETVEADLATGQLNPAQAQAAMQTARAIYDTAVALATIEADFPRWETWVGTLPHLLYARLPLSSPPIVVRGATPEALRAEVEAAERRLRP